MKPIKRGMTEAVTRGGRKVTELTWFEGVDDGFDSVYGVIDGMIYSWAEDGAWVPGKHPNDIFAPVEYEWQWLIKHNDGTFSISAFRSYDKTVSGDSCDKGDAIWYSRIEESKREVQS